MYLLMDKISIVWKDTSRKIVGNGTVSIAHRCLAQTKKAKEEKKSAPSRNTQQKKFESKKERNTERSDTEKLYSRMMDAPWRPISFTPEELEENFRIGHTYNVNTTKRHNELVKDYAWKIALRKEAQFVLPPDLKKHALSNDDSDFPIERRMATWTPPIPDFDAEYYRRRMLRKLDAEGLEEKRKAEGLEEKRNAEEGRSRKIK